MKSPSTAPGSTGGKVMIEATAGTGGPLGVEVEAGEWIWRQLMGAIAAN
ncbi:MAG: hypothetical protein H6632_09455 [Anaerolineales bacterium]|nr:hypothetical protein [Anaerolineales bacterium]